VILWPLAEKRAETAAQLARYTGVDTGAISRLLGRMGNAGLISVRQDPRDGRRLLVKRTAKARRLHPELETVVQENLEDIFAGVTRAEVRQLKKVLLTLLSNAGRSELS
jgi:MarR family transcriptional regulator, organic hydroperoxide resistance regulator